MPGSGKGACPRPRTRQLVFQMLWESRCWRQSLWIKGLIGNQKANLEELRWESKLMQLSFLCSAPPHPCCLSIPHQVLSELFAFGWGLPSSRFPSPSLTVPRGHGGVILLGMSGFLTGLNTELGQFILDIPNGAASFSFPFYFLTCFQLPFWCFTTA